MSQATWPTPPDVDLGPCNVCGEQAHIVACSSLGACSFAYCTSCNDLGCEPYDATVSMVATIGDDPTAIAEWFHKVLVATLLRAKKTPDEFWADVRTKVEQDRVEYQAYVDAIKESSS